MWIALLVGVIAAWVLLAGLVAVMIGRAVRVADRRRPKVRTRSRATTALGRAVELATGQIPMIRPRIVKAVTGAIPLVRAHNS